VFIINSKGLWLYVNQSYTSKKLKSNLFKHAKDFLNYDSWVFICSVPQTFITLAQ